MGLTRQTGLAEVLSAVERLASQLFAQLTTDFFLYFHLVLASDFEHALFHLREETFEGLGCLDGALFPKDGFERTVKVNYWAKRNKRLRFVFRPGHADYFSL